MHDFLRGDVWTGRKKSAVLKTQINASNQRRFSVDRSDQIVPIIWENADKAKSHASIMVCWTIIFGLADSTVYGLVRLTVPKI